MTQISDKQWWWIGVGGILLLALYRLLLIVFGNIPIDLEEAYYLSWTERLEWGYFSKPPLLPAILGFVTQLFGDAPWVLKSLAVAFYSAVSLVVMALARELFADWRTAALSALAFAVMPLISALSLFISTDAPLLLFWALAMYAGLRAMRSNSWRWWLLVGLFGGLGMLSKYTMGVLAVGLLGFVLTSGRWRILFGAPFWSGIVVAVLVWSPNLLWLSGHDYITLEHTKHISQVENAGLNWSDLRDFLLSQIGVFGAVMALALLLGLRFKTFWQGEARSYLLWTSLPLLGLIGVQALSSEANINWAGPAYIGLVILMVDWMLRADRPRGLFWLKASFALHLVLMVAFYHYHALADAVGADLTRKTDPYFKRLGWEGVAKQFRVLRERYPDAPLVSSERKLLALLGYHTRDIQPVVLRSWNASGIIGSQYDLYNNLADHADDEVILLSSTLLPSDVLSRFAQISTPMTLNNQVYQDLNVTVYAYWAKGFKGYEQ